MNNGVKRYASEEYVDNALANISGGSSTFMVTFTQKEGNTLTADKTIAEVLEAYNEGKNVVGFYSNALFKLDSVGNGKPAFSAFLGLWYSGVQQAASHMCILMNDDENIYYSRKNYQNIDIDACRNNLTTTSKNIVGAINEVNEKVDNAFANIEVSDVVKYTEQELTDEQKTIARANIGANGYDWHELSTNRFVANLVGKSGVLDWEKALSDSVLDATLTSIMVLLEDEAKSATIPNKELAAENIRNNLPLLIENGVVSNQFSAVFSPSRLDIPKYVYFYVFYNANTGKCSITDLTNDTRVIQVTNGEITYDTTSSAPDITLSVSRQSADAKAVGDALALKADKTTLEEVNINVSSLQEIVTPTSLILSSPNGIRFSITVGDDGVLTATEIEETTES